MTVNPYQSSTLPSRLAAADWPLALPLRLEYELTVEDLVAFQLSHGKRSAAVRLVAITVFGLAAAIVPIAVAIAVLRSDHTTAFNVVLISWAAVCAVVLGGIALWAACKGPPFFFLTALLIRHHLARRSNARLIGPHQLTLTDQELCERSPNVDNRYPLSAVTKVIHAPQHLFLYTSPLQAIIIPKRGLGDRCAPQDLASLFQELTGVRATPG